MRRRGPTSGRRSRWRRSQGRWGLALIVSAVAALLLTARAGAQETGPTAAPPSADTLRTGTEPNPSAPAVSDTLPFAGNDLPAHYPSFGFGYGILANQAGYHDLEHALTRMEDFYRQQGFTIHPHRRVGLDRLQFWSLALRLNRHIDIVAEVGRVSEKQGYLHTSDTMALIHWTPRPGNSPGLFAGLGGGEYAFSWKQEYHDPVSPVGSGGWYELESIRFSWHGVYASAVAGVALRPSTNTLIEIYGQHLMMKTVRVQSLNVGRLSIDLSGSLLGARLRLYY